MSASRRSKLVIDGDWRFNIDREEKGEERGWQTPAYADEHWGLYPVPGSWDLYLPELFGYVGVAWYRHSFAVKPLYNLQVDLFSGRRLLDRKRSNDRA